MPQTPGKKGKEESVKRTYRREFVMTEFEAKDLKEKARKARLKESQLIRLLISGYHPPEAPGDEFHDDMNGLLDAAEKFYSLAEKTTDSEMKELLKTAYAELRVLRMRIQQKYLSGERVSTNWR